MINSERLYRFLLRMYPSPFLRDYGDPIRQAFRDQLRDANTKTKRARLWARTLIDLTRSGLSVRFDDKESGKIAIATLAAYLFWGAAGAFLMRFERHTDDSGVVVFFLLVITFVLGCGHPRRAWLWSQAGLSIPAAHLFGSTSLPPFNQAVPLTGFVLAVGFAGSYAGVLARKLAAR